MKDFADVLRILAPRISTRGAFLADIQLGSVVALSIAAITAEVRTQSKTDTGRTPALAVIDNRRSSVVEDQVTARAPVGLPAIEDVFNFFGKRNPIILSVLRKFPGHADSVIVKMGPAQLPNLVGTMARLIGKSGDIRHVWRQAIKDCLRFSRRELPFTPIARFVIQGNLGGAA